MPRRSHDLPDTEATRRTADLLGYEPIFLELSSRGITMPAKTPRIYAKLLVTQHRVVGVDFVFEVGKALVLDAMSASKIWWTGILPSPTATWLSLS